MWVGGGGVSGDTQREEKRGRPGPTCEKPPDGDLLYSAVHFSAREGLGKLI